MRRERDAVPELVKLRFFKKYVEGNEKRAQYLAAL
jgi:hypothetical protein